MLLCRALLHPYSTDGDVMGHPSDPWVAAARKLAPEGWGPRKQVLMARTFLEFFSEALDRYEEFVVRGSGGRRATTADAVTAGGAAAGSTGGALGVAAAAAAVAAGTGAGAGATISPRARHCATSGGGSIGLGVNHSGSLGLGRISISSSCSRFTGLSGGAINLNVNMPGLMAHHEARTP